MKGLIQDLRYGFRMLINKPGFTAVAIITLALGIGANTAIFSVVNAVLLRPLPFPDPERLAMVSTTNLARGFTNFGTSMPDFRAWRERNTTFEKMAAYSTTNFNISGTIEPERVTGARVSTEMFSLLGVGPIRGRSFTNDEGIFGKHHVAIISDGLWQRRFGPDAGLTDQTITLDGEKYAIIGVMPRGFEFPDPAVAVWVPIALADGSEKNTRGDYWLSVVARLNPGVHPSQAQAELEGIFRQLEQEETLIGGFGARVTLLHEATVASAKTALLVLLAAVGLVLLIACANVANLLLARGAVRQREIAIRIALGAGRGRLIRQLFTESLLIGLSGGVLGLLLAVWCVDVLIGLGPNVPRLQEVGIDRPVLVFTFALAVLTSVIFGLVPALQSSKTDLNETLKESGRSATGGARRRVLGKSLVVVEVALSFVLLAGAGLMINSLLRLQQVNPGFRTDRILTMHFTLPAANYPEDRPDLTVGFFQQLIERVKALPGVESAGVSTALPLTNSGWGKLLTLEDRPAPTSLDDVPNVQYRQVSHDYFGTLAIPVTKGRSFNEQDTRNALPVAIINETAARMFFADSDPIGKRLYLGPPEQLVPPGILPPGFRFPHFTIVGVIGDVRHDGFNQPLAQEVYTLHEQELASKFANPSTWMYLAVRTAGEPSNLVGAIRHEVQQVDREQPIADIATMEELVATSLSQSRFSTLLLGVFAGVALILAAVGLYGVMAYNVAQRTHEIGIRVALGAQVGDVRRMIIRQGLMLTLTGILIGLGAALIVTRVMTSLLYDVTPTDPLTFAIIPVVLTAVALAASFIPARRAMKVDPMVALRCE
jgi:putative ABC transport system permease protein